MRPGRALSWAISCGFSTGHWNCRRRGCKAQPRQRMIYRATLKDQPNADDSPRTPALFRHRRPAAAEPAGRRPGRGVDCREPGILEHRARDAALRALAAHGPADAAGRAELGLA